MYPFIYRLIYLSMHPHIYLSIYLSIYFPSQVEKGTAFGRWYTAGSAPLPDSLVRVNPIYQLIYLSMYPYIYLSIYLSIPAGWKGHCLWPLVHPRQLSTPRRGSRRRYVPRSILIYLYRYRYRYRYPCASLCRLKRALPSAAGTPRAARRSPTKVAPQTCSARRQHLSIYI